MTIPIGSREVVGFLSLSGQGIYAPEAYGAKRDGVTDDTAAVQAAVTACAAAGGGTILFARGTYKTTATVSNSHDGVHLVGVGDSTIIDFEPVADDVAFEFSNGVGSVLFCSMSGFRFKSTDVAHRKTMLRVVDVRGFVAESIRSLNAEWTGHISIGIEVCGREEVRIRDCYMMCDLPVRYELNPNLAMFSIDHSSIEGCEFAPNVLAPVVIGPLDDLVWDDVGRTCTRTAGSWVADGVTVNASFVVSGSDLNNGPFTCAAVSALVLEVHEPVVADADDDSVTFTTGDRASIEFHPDSVVTNWRCKDTAFNLGSGAIRLKTGLTCTANSFALSISNCRSERGTQPLAFYFDITGKMFEFHGVGISDCYSDIWCCGVRLSGVRTGTLTQYYCDKTTDTAFAFDATDQAITMIGCLHLPTSVITGAELVNGFSYVNCQDAAALPPHNGSYTNTAVGHYLRDLPIIGGAYGLTTSGAGSVDLLSRCSLKDQTTYALYCQTGGEQRVADCDLHMTLNDRDGETMVMVVTGGIARLHDCTLESAADGAHKAYPILVTDGTVDACDVLIAAPTAEAASYGIYAGGTAAVKLHNVDVTLENHATSYGVYLDGANCTCWRSGWLTMHGIPDAQVVGFGGAATQAQCNWGTATLVAGVKSIPCLWARDAAHGGMQVHLTCLTPAGTPNPLRISAIVDATSFEVTSDDAADTSTIAWRIEY